MGGGNGGIFGVESGQTLPEIAVVVLAIAGLAVAEPRCGAKDAECR